MLHYAVVFFVIALIAALFGFGGIAAGAAGIAIGTPEDIAAATAAGGPMTVPQ